MNNPKSKIQNPKSSNAFIPLSVPHISGNEWKYIKDCLDSNWVSSVGSYVDKFERMVAEYSGTANGVAMSNGTSALHIALLVAGIETNDEVIVPALTFISPVNTVKYAGAHPVFMDVESSYLGLDAEKLDDFIKKECTWRKSNLCNRCTGRRIAGIIPVDLLGHPVDLDPIIQLVRKFNIKIIEDATESLGAEYKGRKIGSHSDICCFSFNGNKIITTGGGGMLVTNNDEYAEKARYLSQQAKDDPLEYYHRHVGYNYRLTNIQAAMGCAQMELLDSYVEKKRAIAKRYDKGIGGLDGISIPKQAGWAKSTFWLYTILIDRKRYGMDSRTLLRKLQELKIQSRPLWHPIHLLPPYDTCQSYKVENATRLYRDALSIPCSVGMSVVEQNKVIRSICKESRH